MKKYSLTVMFLILAMTFVNAQGISQGQSQEQASRRPVSQLDAAVKILAESLNKKLIEVKAGKIAVGQFAYRGNAVLLGYYLVNQLTGELANMPNKSYIILSGGPAGAEWTVSGEIIEAAGTIRLYTRLIRAETRAVEASFHFDFERNEQITGMLNSWESQGGRSSSAAMDFLEPDSFDNPVPYEIGVDDNAMIVNRTLHNGDEDFFLLIPENDGQLIAETTGSIDTYMEFYNADTREKLGQNDDGGSGYNAQIRYSVQTGKRYIAKVRGCDSSDTGAYGFRAYLQAQVRLAADEYEPDNDSASAKQIEIGVSQQHTFHNSADTDWVKFQITQAGRYVIRTRGVNSNRLDTYIELYNSNMNLVGEDDDGGENLDSMLSLRLERGLYYLKVECLNENPDQPYTISIEADRER
jgi:hypothetical protein